MRQGPGDIGAYRAPQAKRVDRAEEDVGKARIVEVLNQPSEMSLHAFFAPGETAQITFASRGPFQALGNGIGRSGATTHGQPDSGGEDWIEKGVGITGSDEPRACHLSSAVGKVTGPLNLGGSHRFSHTARHFRGALDGLIEKSLGPQAGPADFSGGENDPDAGSGGTHRNQPEPAIGGPNQHRIAVCISLGSPDMVVVGKEADAFVLGKHFFRAVLVGQKRVPAAAIDDPTTGLLGGSRGVFEDDPPAISFSNAGFYQRFLAHFSPRRFGSTQQDFIESGTLDLKGSFGQGTHCLTKIDGSPCFAIGRNDLGTMFGDAARCPNRILDAELLQKRDVGGEQRFPDMEPGKFLSFTNKDAGAGLCQLVCRGRPCRPAADDDRIQ